MCVIPIGLREKNWLVQGLPISGVIWLPFQLPAAEVTLPCETSPVNQVKKHANLCFYPTFHIFVPFPILSLNSSKSWVGNLSQMSKLWFSKIKWLAQGQITLDSLCPVTVRPVKEGRGASIEIIGWGCADGEWDLSSDIYQDFPGGPVAKTPSCQCRGPGVQSPVRELDTTCFSLVFACTTRKKKILLATIKKFRVPQLKILLAETKDRRSRVPELRPSADKSINK